MRLFRFILRLKFSTQMEKPTHQIDHQQTGIVKKKIKVQQKPLKQFIDAQCGFARATTIILPHGEVKTPMYMPVGTKGTMKGILAKQMEQLGCRILLSNTYHLGYKPGAQYLQKVGGLHKFMNWKYNILTDSGGFQMVSLSKLCELTEEGVKFTSPYDGSLMSIRPEDSIHIQNKIGSDIMMALDDVVKTTTVGPRMQEAMERTCRWIDRNLQANENPDRQNLFPIVQGGVDDKLRQQCLKQLIKRDANGYAIGGLSGGQLKEDFFRTVRLCCQKLPKNKPRYLMGVGYPVDVALCACLGVDLFDCVFPTRTARFGTAFTSYGQIKLKNKNFATDFTKIEQDCTCQACSNYTKAYLHTISSHDNFCHLLSMHNIAFLYKLVAGIRKSIAQQNLPQFMANFLNDLYSQEKKIPSWVKSGLQYAKLAITLKHPYYQAQNQ